jgi:amino acid permease
MNSIVSIAFLVAGVILIVFGVAASDSLGSTFSRAFTGAPTDKTIWLLVSGIVLGAIGLVGLLRGGKAS